MRKLLNVILLMALFSIAQAQQDTTSIILSLEKAQELAKTQNLELKNSKLDENKVNFQLKEAKSKLYPQIEAYSNFNYNYAIPKIILPGEIIGQTGMIPVEMGTKLDWSSGLKATQVIFNLSYFTSLKMSEKMTEISKLSYEKKEKELLNQISKIYFLAISTKMQISKLQKSIEDADKLIKITQSLNQQGFVRKIDVSKININKNNLLSQIDNLQLLHGQQKNLLKFLVGIKSDKNIELSDTTIFLAAYSKNEPNFDNKEDVLLLTKQLEVTELTKKSLKGLYVPSLALFWQHYYQSQRDKADFFKDTKNNFFKAGLVGLSLNIPLFDGFEKNSKIKQKDIEYQQISNNKELLLDNYSKQYRDALIQYETGIQTLKRAEENVKIAKDAYEIDLVSYKQGILSQSDILSSENNLIEAEINKINQLFLVKSAELELQQIEQ
ncbi:putative Outer membrane protein [uncultured Paludibacter sp.]|uniref:Putative Outer membrane protein n=1 Tax=uncultured Paludibacter sp. TaxID=497635 RepID=A0A653AJK7_9BACT|nr:putative Outer membrane protein [uncultured Paludibacter sp.]